MQWELPEGDPLDPSGWQEIGTIERDAVQFTPERIEDGPALAYGRDYRIEGDPIRTDQTRELSFTVNVTDEAAEGWRALHQILDWPNPAAEPAGEQDETTEQAA